MLCRVVRCVVLSAWLATHKRLYSANNVGPARLKALHIYFKGPLTSSKDNGLIWRICCLQPMPAPLKVNPNSCFWLFNIKWRHWQLYESCMSALLRRRVNTSFGWEREIADFKKIYWGDTAWILMKNSNGNVSSLIYLRINSKDSHLSVNEFFLHLPAHSDFSIIAFLTSSRSSTIVQKELRGGPSDSSRPRQSVLSSPS